MTKPGLVVFLLVLFSRECFSQSNVDTSLNLFFETARFDLNVQQYDSLKSFIRLYPSVIQINGYADTVGTKTANLKLSKRRALAVYDAVKRNHDSLPLNTVSYNGESEIFPQSWMNRRVQIVARKPAPMMVEKPSAGDTKDALRELNLDNVYFVPDKPVLLQESTVYIQELAQKLKDIPEGKFEIVGHVNYQSRLDSTHLADLYELSRLRAKAVYDYLVQLGIPAERMTYKGVGNSEPLFASPKNEEEKRKNMRVQVIIRN